MDKGADAAPERIVGRYALYGEIASGGMATVHYGRLIGPVGFSRTVAIKRLHSQFAKDPEFVSMFLDEARLAARIRHPNAVSTLDVVALEGELFLVMDYVQGEALSRLVRLQRATGTPIPLPILGAIMCGALHGLHAAHEAKSERDEPLGIVHRDISPQNVMVGIDGVARVLDFGVAKAAGRVHTTRDGQVKGKLPYMAPEQIRGEAIDRRVDVYAASVVLWEALAGGPLFRGENDGAVFAKVVEGAKVPPSQFNPAIPPAVDALVMRGLKRDPDARFATAREMAIALEEAAGVAPPRHVGEWIESVAGDSLAARADRVKEIESASSGVFSIGNVSPASADAPAPSVPETSDSAETSVQRSRPNADKTYAQSQVSSISVSGNTSMPPPRPRRAPLVVGGAIALALATGATFAWIGRGAAPAPVSGAPTSSVAAPSVDPIPPATTIAAAPASASAAPIASALPINPPSSRKAVPAATPRAAPKANCNPPFTIDSSGIRRPKTECL